MTFAPWMKKLSQKLVFKTHKEFSDRIWPYTTSQCGNRYEFKPASVGKPYDRKSYVIRKTLVFFIFIIFSQKLTFSKFFELSGNSSCSIRPGFVVLFHYSKDFKLTFTIFEKKNRFFEEKWSFVKEWCMFILSVFFLFL